MSQVQVQPGENVHQNAQVSFERAIEREALAFACIQALTEEGEPGAGLKVLRLVSKQVNIAMQKHIRGFTLKLDGVTEEMPDLGMLRLTQLMRLRVLVSVDPRMNCIGVSHVRQIQRFIMEARQSLLTVTTMDLSIAMARYYDYQDYPVSEFDAAAVLVPLAYICSKLQQLHVNGDIGAPLLAAFGVACAQLTSLEIADAPVHTVNRLSELLPRVTSTHMTLVQTDFDESLDRYQLALSSCSTLTRLDIPALALSANLWRALPPSIQELHIGPHEYEFPFEEAFPPWDIACSMPTGLQLPNLREVVFQDSLMHLDKLARVLRAAPQLQRLRTRGVWVPCRVDQIPDLVLVNQRLAAGLVVFGSCGYRSASHSSSEGLVLQFKDLSDTHPDSPASRFLLALPVLEHIANISLAGFSAPQAVLLARAFPRLRMLTSFDTDRDMLSSSSFPSLKLFPLLETLTFTYGYSAAELGALCLQIPSLRYLNVNLRPEKRAALAEILDTWASAVVVNYA